MTGCDCADPVVFGHHGADCPATPAPARRPSRTPGVSGGAQPPVTLTADQARNRILQRLTRSRTAPTITRKAAP